MPVPVVVCADVEEDFDVFAGVGAPGFANNFASFKVPKSRGYNYEHADGFTVSAVVDWVEDVFKVVFEKYRTLVINNDIR